MPDDHTTAVPGGRDEPAGRPPWSAAPPTWGSAPTYAQAAPYTQPSSPTQPPYGRSPYGQPPSTPTGPSRPRGRRGLAALAVVATFAAGAGGVLVGTEIAGEDTPATSTGRSPDSTRPVTTEPGPVEPGADEPVAAVAAALSPAVVQIETRTGLGSGFVYDESGLIMTAAHVTDGADTVTVRTADGVRTEGEVLGADGSTDVAVVKIDPDEVVEVATLATGIAPQVGQTAVAIGSPFGLDQTVTAGIVSAVGRTTETPGGLIPAIQTDAPINSGNSGGALADAQGRVIGINDSIITGGRQGTGNVGIGFAVPIDLAAAVADKIVAGDDLTPGYLGVSGADATGGRTGAAITEVEPGSPADRAGIDTRDVIVEAAGRKVSSMIDLGAVVRTQAPGDTITLTVVRGDQERTVEVTLGASPTRGN